MVLGALVVLVVVLVVVARVVVRRAGLLDHGDARVADVGRGLAAAVGGAGALVLGQLARVDAGGGRLVAVQLVEVLVAAGAVRLEVEPRDGEEPGRQRAHEDGADDDDPAEGAGGAVARLADEARHGEVDDGAPEDDLDAVDDGVGLERPPPLEGLDVLGEELVGDEDERFGTLVIGDGPLVHRSRGVLVCGEH